MSCEQFRDVLQACHAYRNVGPVLELYWNPTCKGTGIAKSKRERAHRLLVSSHETVAPSRFQGPATGIAYVVSICAAKTAKKLGNYKRQVTPLVVKVVQHFSF